MHSFVEHIHHLIAPPICDQRTEHYTCWSNTPSHALALWGVVVRSLRVAVHSGCVRQVTQQVTQHDGVFHLLGL